MHHMYEEKKNMGNFVDSWLQKLQNNCNQREATISLHKNSTKENQKCSQKFLKMEWAFFIMPESTCQNQFQIQHGRTDISPREQSKKKPYLNDQI
jgi:hypothetical protein